MSTEKSARKENENIGIPSERNSNSTICWNCAKSGGKCSWSSCGLPVQGWEAKETAYDGMKYKTSYIVKSCPLFEKEVIRKSTLQKLSDNELPLLEEFVVKKMYCTTDDVYFKSIMDCARYIESKGGYGKKKSIYWLLTDRRSRGMEKVTMGGREYVFLTQKEDM